MDKGAECYIRFLNGDDNGIVEIIKNYKDGLILYLNSITSDMHLAEEATEESFFKLVVKKPKYNGKASFKTWLYTIARNTAYDYLKKHSKRGQLSTDELYSRLKDEENLEASYIKNENRITVHKALNKLNPSHRQALWLQYFENFSTKECADIMGKTPHSVESLTYRAKAALKKILESEGLAYEEL